MGPLQDILVLKGAFFSMWVPFLASQDALEVMMFTYSLLMVSIDLTDVTLVSDDT